MMSITVKTKEECHIEALKYTSRNDFKKGSYRYYESARAKRWLDEICGHMILKLKNRSKEECHIEALKYTSRNDFKKGSNATYYYARKYGWLDDICGHMVSYFKHRTKEDCHNDSLKYTSRTEYCVCDRNSYYVARYNGWLDDICGHMISQRDRINVLYIWKCKDRNIWKIGVCADYNINNRIRDVATLHNMEVDYVYYIFRDDCFDIEKKILSMGTRPLDIERKDGHTEFRCFEQNEIDIIMEYYR